MATRINIPHQCTRQAATLLMAVLTPAFAIAAQPDDDHDPARPMLVAESEALVAGTANHIALTFDIDEDWHIYWPGQNDTGFAPSIELTLPEGWTAGETQWPAPHRYISAGNILDHVYEDGEATFIIPITIPEDAQPGRARITADIEWLVCREACIPGWQTVTLDAEVAPAGSLDFARIGGNEHAPRFAKARERHPVPYKADPHPRRLQPTRWATLAWHDGELRISAVNPPARSPKKTFSLAFYPDESSAPIENLLERGESSGDAARSPAPLVLMRSDQTKPISGIIEVRFLDKSRPALYRIETRPLGEATPASSDSDRSDSDD